MPALRAERGRQLPRRLHLVLRPEHGDLHVTQQAQRRAAGRQGKSGLGCVGLELGGGAFEARRPFIERATCRPVARDSPPCRRTLSIPPVHCPRPGMFSCWRPLGRACLRAELAPESRGCMSSRCSPAQPRPALHRAAAAVLAPCLKPAQEQPAGAACAPLAHTRH